MPQANNGPKFFLITLLTVAVVGMMGYASINRFLKPSSIYRRSAKSFQIIADLDNITRIAINVEQDSVKLELELKRLRELATKYTDLFQENRKNYSCDGKRCTTKLNKRLTATSKRFPTTTENTVRNKAETTTRMKMMRSTSSGITLGNT